MTAQVAMLTDEEIIERWKLSCLCGGVSAITTAKMVRNFYEARLAEDAKVRASHLKLAQIEALEWVQSSAYLSTKDDQYELDRYELDSRITALRKELGE